MCFDEETKIWNNPYDWNKFVSVRQFEVFHSPDCLKMYYECGFMLQALDLTQQEHAALHSYLLLFTRKFQNDRCILI